VFEEIKEASLEHIEKLKKNFHKLGIEPVVLKSPDVDSCCRIFFGYFENGKREEDSE
jgi:hypothetical protein